jgi:predicted ATP-grasp superfamily ATP-dependent carboligase
MSKLITSAERIERARNLIQQAREYPVPPDTGWTDFSYTAQVKDLLRQARDLIKFIGYTSGVNAEVKAESKAISGEIDLAVQDLLHHPHS